MYNSAFIDSVECRQRFVDKEFYLHAKVNGISVFFEQALKDRIPEEENVVKLLVFL